MQQKKIEIERGSRLCGPKPRIVGFAVAFALVNGTRQRADLEEEGAETAQCSLATISTVLFNDSWGTEIWKVEM